MANEYINIPNVQNEEHKYGEKKIRELLTKYGIEESEIENFINDLNDTKENIDEIVEENREEEIDETGDDYLLNKDTINKLKETPDGINLLIKAPEMAKEELKKAIADYLQK